MSRLLSLALLPAAVLLVYIYRMDTIEKEPLRLLAKLFALGAVCAAPAALLEVIGSRLIAPMQGSWQYSALDAFCVVAVAEEGCKYVVARSTWRNPAFDYRFDAIVYCVTVSLGFAALENLLYVCSYGFGTALIRAVTSVPGHCFFGVYMGYHMGNAKYRHFYGLRGSELEKLLALVVPVLLHGCYDFLCFMSGKLLFILAFYVYLAVFFLLAVRCVRRSSACDAPVA